MNLKSLALASNVRDESWLHEYACALKFKRNSCGRSILSNLVSSRQERETFYCYDFPYYFVIHPRSWWSLTHEAKEYWKKKSQVVLRRLAEQHVSCVQTILRRSPRLIFPFSSPSAPEKSMSCTMYICRQLASYFKRIHWKHNFIEKEALLQTSWRKTCGPST